MPTVSSLKAGVTLHPVLQFPFNVLRRSFFEVARVARSPLVRRKLVVETIAHHVVFVSLVVVQFHDRYAIVIVMNLGPGVMAHLTPFIVINTICGRVFMSILADVRLKGDGTESVGSLIWFEQVRIADGVVDSDREVAFPEYFGKRCLGSILKLFHNCLFILF